MNTPVAFPQIMPLFAIEVMDRDVIKAHRVIGWCASHNMSEIFCPVILGNDGHALKITFPQHMTGIVGYLTEDQVSSATEILKKEIAEKRKEWYGV